MRSDRQGSGRRVSRDNVSTRVSGEVDWSDVTDYLSDGDKGKQSAVYPAVAGISVQAVAALRSGSAGAWTVPPGGLHFT